MRKLGVERHPDYAYRDMLVIFQLSKNLLLGFCLKVSKSIVVHEKVHVVEVPQMDVEIVIEGGSDGRRGIGNGSCGCCIVLFVQSRRGLAQESAASSTRLLVTSSVRRMARQVLAARHLNRRTVSRLHMSVKVGLGRERAFAFGLCAIEPRGSFNTSGRHRDGAGLLPLRERTMRRWDSWYILGDKVDEACYSTLSLDKSPL